MTLLPTAKYIKSHWKKQSDPEMAAELGISRHTCRWYRRQMGLIRTNKESQKLRISKLRESAEAKLKEVKELLARK
jgi:hypothetical protein